MQNKERPYLRPDNEQLPLSEEKRLNEAFALVFRDAHKPGAQKLVLDYLKSISLNAVLPAGVDPNVLMHREGSRWLVGVIETRINYGAEKLPEIKTEEKKK